MKKTSLFALGLTVALAGVSFVGCGKSDKLDVVDYVTNASNASFQMQKELELDLNSNFEVQGLEGLSIAPLSVKYEDSWESELMLYAEQVAYVYAYEYFLKALEVEEIEYTNNKVYYDGDLLFKSNFEDNNCNFIINNYTNGSNLFNVEINIKSDSDGNPKTLTSKTVLATESATFNTTIAKLNFDNDTLLVNHVNIVTTTPEEATLLKESFSEGMSFEEVLTSASTEISYSIETSKIVMSGETSSTSYVCNGNENVEDDRLEHIDMYNAIVEDVDNDLTNMQLTKDAQSVETSVTTNMVKYANSRSECLYFYSESGDFTPKYTFLNKNEMLAELNTVKALVEDVDVLELLNDGITYLNTTNNYNGYAGELRFCMQKGLANNMNENVYYTLSVPTGVGTYAGVIYSKDGGDVTLVKVGDISAEIRIK